MPARRRNGGRVSPRTRADLETWLHASGLGRMDCPDPSALPLFTAILPDGRLRKGARGLPAPLTGRSIARILTGLGDAADLPDVSSTAIQRSMARILRAHGIDDGEIAVRGRWSSIAQMRSSVGLAPPEHDAPSLVR